MKRYFKSSNKKHNNFYIWLFLFIISLSVSFILVHNITLDYLIFNDKKNFFDFKIDKKKLLYKLSFNINNKDYKNINVFNEINDFSEVEENDNINDYKTIYLYNTHQTEEYIDYNVYEATKYLKEELIKYKINAIVEEKNIKEELENRQLSYKDSYKITRELLTNNLNDKIELYIDFHRDSLEKNKTLYEDENTKYAKVLFVIGGKHETYNNNYEVAENLNKLLKNKNQNLSRGIYVRKDSTYNQDLDNNIILIEIGGQDNNKEEVNNTLRVLAEIIYLYLGE